MRYGCSSASSYQLFIFLSGTEGIAHQDILLELYTDCMIQNSESIYHYIEFISPEDRAKEYVSYEMAARMLQDPGNFFSRIKKYDPDIQGSSTRFFSYILACHGIMGRKERLASEEWIKSHGLIESLLAYRSPNRRYDLSASLVRVSKDPKLRTLYGKPSRHHVLWMLPLIDLQGQGVNVSAFQGRCSKSAFRDKKKHIIDCLTTLNRQTALTPQEKSRLLNLVASGKTPADVVKGMKTLTACCLLEGADLLKDKQIASLADLQRVMEVAFRRVVPVGKIPSFAEKYEMMNDRFRDPSAITTYAGKLRQLPDPSAYLKLYAKYIENVMELHWPSVRYEFDYNSHLKAALGEREELMTAWVKGTSQPLEVRDVKQEATNYREILTNKILVDKHINPEEYPVIAAALKGEKVTGGKPLEKLLMQLLDPSTDEDEVLGKISEECSRLNLQQFKADINGLILGLAKEKKVETYKGFTINDTDDACDLLLSGTEVAGSCQDVNGTPNLNRNLLAYLMDGKNRMLAIKDFRGKIVARAIFRLLLDVKNQPVLFVERVYPDKVKAELKDALDRFAVERAKDLGLPLFTADKKMGEPYDGTLVSLGGPAPSEYVDAAGGERPEGKFEITNMYRVS